MSRIAVRLWVLCPESDKWCKISGSRISARRYEIVSALFQEAFLVRHLLGTGFDDLCRLVIAYSEQRGESSEYYRQDPAREERLRTWQEEWCQKFANGIVPEIGEHWGTTLGASPVDTAGDRSRIDYGFDVFLCTSAFECIPADETAPDITAAERTAWRRLDENLFRALLRTLPDDVVCEDRDRAPMPGQSEMPILQRSAMRCVTSSRPEDARQFWMPLLEKGPYAARFAQLLLSCTKGAARRRGIDARGLIPLFQGWLEFMQTSPKWANGSRSQEDLWRELLFIEQFIDAKDDVFFAPVMLALAPHYEAAVRDDRTQQFEFANLIHHLSGLATRPLLPQVFEWCAEKLAQPGKIYWKDKTLLASLSELVDAAWKHCMPAIRARPSAYGPFKKAVLALAAEQDPVALEVQAVLGRDAGMASGQPLASASAPSFPAE